MIRRNYLTKTIKKKNIGGMMSIPYEVYVEARSIDASKIEAITDAASKVWSVDETGFLPSRRGVPNCLYLEGADYLPFDEIETEDELAQHICEAIWEANEGFCKVTVTCTDLSTNPTETYSFTKDDFANYRRQ
ncbi:MAG: hypothetical protein DRN26_00025 [Thermoplasmata archaeon]|nr:MAG: hypothetical protein DRN26_00025 [Thermoplasmata archaeon]